MATRTQIINEINTAQREFLAQPMIPKNPTPEQQKMITNDSFMFATNKIRKKYLTLLSQKTGRNTIIYYSGFMKIHNEMIELSIEDNDINGFMSAIAKLDKTKGLDLVLHTPGGSLSAAESIVDYLRAIFGTNIRVIIPQLALSAGTMIACASSEIIMGKHSYLGPTDPQFKGLSAHGIVEEFETAQAEILKNEKSVPLWREIIAKYPPSLVGECRKAIALSTELVIKWLETGMFKDDVSANKIATTIVTEYLNNHKMSKTHDRHFNITKCKDFGLKIVELEKDNDLQELVLSLHHATMISIDIIAPLKIIESQLNEPWLVLIKQN